LTLPKKARTSSTTTRSKAPAWRSDGFNAIKHDRANQFAAANRGNALNAVSGLLVLLLYYYDALPGSPAEISAFDMARLFDEQAGPLPPGLRKATIRWDYHLPK
jgi:hypothetical protein